MLSQVCLYIADWKDKLKTSQPRDARIKVVAREILKAEPLARHEKVEPTAECLMKMIEKMDPLSGNCGISSALSDARMDGCLARRYLAGVAMVQWSTLRQ